MISSVKCEVIDIQNHTAATLIQHAENDYLILFIHNSVEDEPAKEILSVKLYPDGHWEKI